MSGSEGTSERPVLCLVVDRAVSRWPLVDAVRVAAESGVDWLQLRERGLEGAAWLDWAATLAETARAANPAVRIIVNRRLDVALAIGADGAHLGFDAASPADASKLLGADALVGVSAHDTAEVRAAAKAGAGYVHLAPIFDPRSKPASRPALGLDPLAEACRQGIAVLAQGGIDAPRCAPVIAAGATGVAVTGTILLAQRPDEAATALRKSLDHTIGAHT